MVPKRRRYPCRETPIIPPVALGWCRVCREREERRYGGCMRAPLRDSPYCAEHRFKALVRTWNANRAKGLCKCGAPVRPGECGPGPNYGKAHTLCERCDLKRRRRVARKREERRRRAEIEWRYRSPNPNAPLSWHTPPPPLDEKRRAFVNAYVEHGNASRAAREAGYCAASTARGGRAASKRGCLLLKDERVRRAIRERRLEVEAEGKARAEKERAALVERRNQAREAMVRKERAEFIATLEAFASPVRPHSRVNRLIRRLTPGQDTIRLPGHCRCGAPVTPGVHVSGKYQDRAFSSCAPCRDRNRRHLKATRKSRAKPKPRRPLGALVDGLRRSQGRFS